MTNIKMRGVSRDVHRKVGIEAVCSISHGSLLSFIQCGGKDSFLRFLFVQARPANVVCKSEAVL
jgi:hypothetical protein